VTALSDASDAVTFVRSTIGVKSVNNPKDYTDFSGSSENRQHNLNLYNAQRDSALAKYKGNSTIPQDVVASARTAMALQIGNCEAQAALGYCFIVEKRQSAVWLVGLSGYDHAFLVVGPPEGAKYNDPSTWTNAVICDPWANETYAASELVTKMKALFKATDGAGGIEEEENSVKTSCQLDSRLSGDKLPEKVLA
jgi:hypothetical protein